MVSCTKYDIEQNYAEFYSDTTDEMVNLPDLTHSGKAQLQNILQTVSGQNSMMKVVEITLLIMNFIRL